MVDRMREEVETGGTRVLVIDSLNGFLAAMPEEQFLIVQPHELLMYLRQRGVLTILTLAQAGMIGAMPSPVDVTFLADTAGRLRFFEAHGESRKALSVLKLRLGSHA